MIETQEQHDEVKTNDAFARAFMNPDDADMSTPTPIVKAPSKGKKALKIVGIILGVLIVFGGIAGAIGFFGYQKAMALKAKAEDVKFAGKEAYDALKVQNLVLADERMAVVRTKLDALNQEYKTIAWVGKIPKLGSYYNDGTHAVTAGYAGLDAAGTLLKAIEPYADVLGFKGQGSFTGGSAEERIVKIIETLDKVSPSIDAVTKSLDTVGSELAQIDENRYPEEFRGQKVRSLISQAKQFSSGAVDAVTQAKPIIDVLPDLAGGKTRQKYLVLFQNSGELRPTGGFMTGYAILNVDKGKVEPEGSGDIYDLDKQFKKRPAIPPILKKFLTTETAWNLRDMNMSPDFKESMDTFYSNYQKVPGQPDNFNGIIAVDTHFLESLIKVLGPVDVPGFGTFSAENDKRCDCPQIIYALSEIIDRPTSFIRENRKGILGPMMKAVLSKAYGAPKQVWPDLFAAGWKNIEGKHIQMRLFTEKDQQAAEAVNAAGRIISAPEGYDYFALIDTNLAGAKSNFFVQSSVTHEIDLPENGRLKHKVTVQYKNPFKASNCNLEAGQLCLNGTLNDWVRFYLPAGAKLLDAKGFDEGSSKQSQDLNHEVVEGVFKLQPLSQAKIEITYDLPYTEKQTYNIYVQRQGGTEDLEHTFIVNGEEHKEIIDKDKKFSFGF